MQEAQDKLEQANNDLNNANLEDTPLAGIKADPGNGSVSIDYESPTVTNTLTNDHGIVQIKGDDSTSEIKIAHSTNTGGVMVFGGDLMLLI